MAVSTVGAGQILHLQDASHRRGCHAWRSRTHICLQHQRHLLAPIRHVRHYGRRRHHQLLGQGALPPCRCLRTPPLAEQATDPPCIGGAQDSKSKLKTFANRGGPVVAGGFNRTGSLFACAFSIDRAHRAHRVSRSETDLSVAGGWTDAVGYDWAKGVNGNVPGTPNEVRLYPCKEEDVKKKKTATLGRR